MEFRSRRRRDEVSLDLTSLLDVIFILLIFFLVTASFTNTEEQSVEVDLPSGSSGAEMQAEQELTLFIESDGSVSLELAEAGLEERIAGSELQRRLQELSAQYADRPVYLRGDESVRYGEVIAVLDAIRASGFRRVYNVVRSNQGP